LEGVVGDPQSWNRYAYTENDPINLSDPSGQGFWEDLGIAIGEIFADVIVGIFATEALPEVMEVEEDADAGFTVTLASGEVLKLAWAAWGAARSAAYNGEHIHQIANGQWVPDGPAGGGGSAPASAPQSGGGPGAGTTDVGSTDASGAGPSGGGATTTASASTPAPGGGTISNPSGGSVWNESDNCLYCNALFHGPGMAELWRNSAGAGNTLFVGTGVVLAGVPAAAEILSIPSVGNFLFQEQIPIAGTSNSTTGLLNSARLARYGWGRVTYGLFPTATGGPAAMYVLRFASGGGSVPWWIHFPYPF
jgi:hypothetical protein